MSTTPTVDELADFWFWLPRQDRLALCAIARLDLWVSVRPWREFGPHEKIALVRAMFTVGELAEDCAQALAGKWRDIQKQAQRS